VVQDPPSPRTRQSDYRQALEARRPVQTVAVLTELADLINRLPAQVRTASGTCQQLDASIANALRRLGTP